jgi:hypothetical protein
MGLTIDRIAQAFVEFTLTIAGKFSYTKKVDLWRKKDTFEIVDILGDLNKLHPEAIASRANKFAC